VVGPRGDVVDVAEVAGGGAAGDDAADVPGVEGCFLGGCGEAVAAAEVQDGAVRVEQDPADLAGAGEHGQDGGVDGSGVLGVREPEPTSRATARAAATAGAAPTGDARVGVRRDATEVEAEVEGVGRAGVSSWWWAGGVEACGGKVFGAGGDDDLNVRVRPDPYPGWSPDLKFTFRRWRVTALGKVLVLGILVLGKVGILDSVLDSALDVFVDVAVDSVICSCP
jgi:hypothetical protein